MTEQENIEIELADALTEKPISIKSEGGKYYYIYPPSIGTQFEGNKVLADINFDKGMLKVNQSIEMLRISMEHREGLLRYVALHTFKRRSDIYNMELLSSRIRELDKILDAADLSTIVLAILRWASLTDTFIKHFHLDKEREQRQRIAEFKKNDSGMTFGGRSLWGQMFDAAAERYGWQHGYILWGISAINLSMMLSDSVSTLYLSKEDKAKMHISDDRNFIDGDTKEGMMKLASILR